MDSTISAEDNAKCLFEFYGRYGSDRRPGINAIIECHNKEVMRHLRDIILDKRIVDYIVNYLPMVQRIMNT